MIKGIGVDISEIARFGKTDNKEMFLEQIFNDDEIEHGKRMYDTNKYWTRLFAIKEALFKAFKIGLQHGSYWQDINIDNNFAVTLSGYFRKLFDKKTKVFIAHSCSKKYAASIALIHN